MFHNTGVFPSDKIFTLIVVSSHMMIYLQPDTGVFLGDELFNI